MEELQIFLQNYGTKEDHLWFFLGHNRGDAWSPKADEVTVTYGKEDLPVVQIQSAQETGTPVVFVCLVDVSGSMDEARMAKVREIITDLADNMKEGDSVCIVAMGDELRFSGYLQDKEEIAAQVEALAVTHEDTNLYLGIKESLQFLESARDTAALRSLIIFSDGADDNRHGITRDEVNKVVQDTRIPIYTVGLPKNAKNESQMESIKVLGSFARISAGGAHYVVADGEMSAAEASEAIYDSWMNTQVVTADISGLSATGQELYLKVTSGGASTGANVPDSNIVAEKAQQTPEETEGPQETEGPEETDAPQETAQTVQESSGFPVSPMVLGGAGIALVLIILLIALLANSKKKKKAREAALLEEQRELPMAEVPFAEEAGVTSELEEQDAEPVQEEEAKEEAPPVPMPAKRGLPVQLIRLGVGENTSYSLEVADVLTMGRSPEKAAFALPDDKSLSGLHCTFRYREGKLYVEDSGSSNGTYVNGVPIKSMMQLHRDDILLAGSYEYRVCFQEG